MIDIQNLMTKHLEIWLTAEREKKSGRGRSSNSNSSIYGVQKLRELILELASLGKLVKNSNENIDTLLKDIDSSKSEKIKSGEFPTLKFKQSSENPKIQLPKNWKWVQLGYLGLTQTGNTPVKEVINLDHKCLPFIRPNHITDNKLIQPTEFVEKILALKYSRVAPPLSILMVCIGSIGKSQVITTESCFNQQINSLTPVMVSSYFILHVMRSSLFLKQAWENSSETTLPILNKGKWEKLWIPLAPLEEQHRIVAKVDELMQLCDQLEQQQNLSTETHEQLVDTLLNALTSSTDVDEFQKNWQNILENFDLLFSTEYSIEQLKQTILQLAVMGKLVKQDPTDEPASELLKQIAKEKEQLIKDGKLKKSKPLPEILESEKPYTLPLSWQWVYLNNIAYVGTGATPSRNNPDYWNPKEISWLSSGETANDFVEITNEKVSLLALEETNLTIYPEGSLIIAMYGQGKTRGQITELKIPTTTNQACAGIVPVLDNIENRKYIKLFFQKIYDEIRELAEGGTQPNLNLNKIQQTKIPFPPLNEQKRIVSKVNQLFSIIEQLQSLQAQRQKVKIELADALILKRN